MHMHHHSLLPEVTKLRQPNFLGNIPLPTCNSVPESLPLFATQITPHATPAGGKKKMIAPRSIKDREQATSRHDVLL